MAALWHRLEVFDYEVDLAVPLQSPLALAAAAALVRAAVTPLRIHLHPDHEVFLYAALICSRLDAARAERTDHAALQPVAAVAAVDYGEAHSPACCVHCCAQLSEKAEDSLSVAEAVHWADESTAAAGGQAGGATDGDTFSWWCGACVCTELCERAHLAGAALRLCPPNHPMQATETKRLALALSRLLARGPGAAGDKGLRAAAARLAAREWRRFRRLGAISFGADHPEVMEAAAQLRRVEEIVAAVGE